MENNVSENVNIESVNEPKKEIETKPVITNKEKRNGKDEKSRKKDDRSIEQILKSLSGLETPEEKLSAMCKKYIEVIDENRKLQMTLKQTEKKVLMIQREKEQVETEKGKAVLTRSRLESLCRELQRQNKAVKEESLLKVREEEEKRKEVSAKFQSTLTEITALMAETNEKNVKLHEDNIEIHKKFKSVFDEMDIREQHFENMHKMMKHELQVAEAKLGKVTLEMTEEKEMLLKEKNQLLLKLTEYQTKIRELQTVEANLRSQVNMYTDKYDEFQTALTKSNEVFGGFNAEMEKMSKKIVKLEKETNVWKLRWEKSHAALLEMATDKQARDSEIASLNKKCLLLQDLCKAFQTERATLIAKLKEKCDKIDPEHIKTEDQNFVESIQSAAKDPTLNGLNLFDNTNAKTEETTKEQKTEEISSVNKTSTNESSRENQNSDVITKENVNDAEAEVISEKTVNSESEKRLVENVPAKVEENNPTIINNQITDQEKCEIEKKLSQVPEKTEDLTQTIEQNIKEPSSGTKQECDPSALNPSNVSECIIMQEVSNKIENRLQESVITEVKEGSVITDVKEKSVITEVKEGSEISDLKESVITEAKEEPMIVTIEHTDTVVGNGNVPSNSVTNKKQKDGKKKKK